MPRPVQGTYPTYFDHYISQVAEDDGLSALKNQQQLIDSFFPSISEEQSNHAYAEGKWTLKELLQHIIDGERIFAYRALSFARQEAQSLPGFEENSYAAVSEAGRRSWSSLCEELKTVRQASIQLFESFSPTMMQQSGIANNNPTTVIATAFIMAGHINHHVKIIRERYLSQAV